MDSQLESKITQIINEIEDPDIESVIYWIHLPFPRQTMLSRNLGAWSKMG